MFNVDQAHQQKQQVLVVEEEEEEVTAIVLAILTINQHFQSSQPVVHSEMPNMDHSSCRGWDRCGLQTEVRRFAGSLACINTSSSSSSKTQINTYTPFSVRAASFFLSLLQIRQVMACQILAKANFL